MSKNEDIARKRTLLSDEKRALLEKRLRGNLPLGNQDIKPDPMSGDIKTIMADWKRQGPLDIDWNQLAEAGHRQAELLPSGFDFDEHTAYERWFDDYCLAYVAIALTRMGIFVTANESHTADELVSRSGILPSYRKLLHRWLIELTDAGLLKEDRGAFTNPQPLPTERPADPWTDSKEVRQSVCEGVVDIITGKKHAVEFFFAGGSTSVAEWGYQLGVAAQYLNSIAAAIVKQLAESAQAERQIRVLEIGAGIGGTSALLLSMLPPDRAAYVFTDLSTYFLDHAKTKFNSYEFMMYDILDINQDPCEQGYKSDSFDLIIAANVMHCASFLDRTLHHMRNILAPRGLLLLLELTQNRPCQMIFPGVLEGFSHFQDQRLRANKPLLTAVEWKDVLRSNGFKEFAAFPNDDNPARALGQHVLLAQSL